MSHKILIKKKNTHTHTHTHTHISWPLPKTQNFKTSTLKLFTSYPCWHGPFLYFTPQPKVHGVPTPTLTHKKIVYCPHIVLLSSFCSIDSLFRSMVKEILGSFFRSVHNPCRTFLNKPLQKLITFITQYSHQKLISNLDHPSWLLTYAIKIWETIVMSNLI
jgi:hypothetical protein